MCAFFRKLWTDRRRLMLLGTVFLVNPHVGCVDLLPDFIGALSYLLALRNCQYVSRRFASAIRRFRLYFVLTLLKVPFTVLLFFLTSRFPTETTLFPLFSFSFSLLEWLLIFPAFFELLRGFELLDERRGPFPSCYIEAIPSLSKLAFLFFLVRGLFSFIPDLLYLTDDAAGLSLTSWYPLAAFVSVLPVLVVAYLFYTAMRNFQNTLSRDAQLKGCFLDAFGKANARIASDRDASVKKLGWLFFTLSALFVLDLSVHSWDVLPDFLTPFCLALAFLLLRKKETRVKKTICIALVFSSLFGLTAELAYGLYFCSYDLRALYYLPEAESAYIVVLVLFFLKLAADLSFLWLLKKPLYSAVEGAEDVLFDDAEIHRQEEKNRLARRKIASAFWMSGMLCSVLEAVCVLCNFFPVRYQADIDLITSGETVLPALDFLRPFFFLAALIRFVYTLWAYTRLTDHFRNDGDTTYAYYIS